MGEAVARRRRAWGALAFYLTVAAAGAASIVWLRHGPLARELQKRRADVAALRTEVAGLEAENEALARRRDALRHDPVAIEREARRLLHYGLPDEVAIRPAPLPTPAVASEGAAPEDGDFAALAGVWHVFCAAFAAHWRAAAVALLVLLVAAVFFHNLRIEDPSAVPRDLLRDFPH